MAWNLLDSFMIALGFHVEHEGIEEFEHHTGVLKSAALRLGTVLTGAAAGVGLFVREMSEGMGKLNDFAELNNISAKSLDAMRYAGIEFEISQDAMVEGLTGLNRKLGEAASGIGRGAMLFKRLHLSARDASGGVRSLWQMLDVLADKMHGQSRAANIALATRLGMDPMFARMLEQGSAKVQAMRKEAEGLIPFSDEDYALADKTNKAFERLFWLMGLVAKQIAVKLMPPVLSAIKAFTAWWKELRNNTASTFNQTLELLSKTLSTVWAWVTRLTGAVYDALAWMLKFRLVLDAVVALVAFLVLTKLSAWFMVLAETIKAATTAMMAFDIASIEINWLALAITAAVLALALLVDDLWELNHGGQSVIGDLTKKWGWFGDAIKQIGDALDIVKTAFMDVWATLKGPLGELKQAFLDVWSILGPVLGPLLKRMLSADLRAFILMLLTFATVLATVLRIAAFGLENIARILSFIFVIGKAVVGVISGLVDKLMKIPGVQSIFGALKMVPGFVEQGASSIAGTTKGVLGKASDVYHNSKNAVQHITQKWEVPVQMMTSDPAAATQNLRDYLHGVHREAVRNGQSAVGI